jgi:hypothetical protein
MMPPPMMATLSLAIAVPCSKFDASIIDMRPDRARCLRESAQSSRTIRQRLKSVRGVHNFGLAEGFV